MRKATNREINLFMALVLLIHTVIFVCIPEVFYMYLAVGIGYMLIYGYASFVLWILTSVVDNEHRGE